MIVYGGARNPEQWPEQARIAPAVPQAIDLTLRSHRETDRFGFDAEADVVTADGITFLQWRTSQASAEKRHSGTVPYTNADTEIWREIAMGSPEGAPVEGVPPVSSGATRATHSESAFQKEGGRMSHYNAPAVPENVKDFRLAGSGAITFPKGRVRLESLRPPEDSQEANIVLWCPEGFGGDVAIEGDIAFSVNGLKNFRRRDEPPLSSGKIGFCQMAPLIGEYANPKVTLP